MPRKQAQDVAAAPRATIKGQFERHTSEDWRELTGSNSGGRWGPEGGYFVLCRPSRNSLALASRNSLARPVLHVLLDGASSLSGRFEQAA
jgi:hypothetical protein